MNPTLEYIMKKYNLTLGKSPIYLPIGRKGLAQLFAELDFNEGAEIGVEQGLFSEELCKANSNLVLDCIDAWCAYKGYRDHVRQGKLDRYFLETTERLKPYGCNIIRRWSMDAVEEFSDASLDFVYIDANHNFKYVAEDIAEWSKKVKPGGIVAGHDYVRNKSSIDCHVKPVVDCWCYTFKINPYFIVTRGDKERLPGDNFPSWFWVK